MLQEGTMLKKAIIFLAGGFEEVEAVTPIDYLRRSGVEVTIAAAGLEGGQVNVKGARGITVCADTTLGELVKQDKLKADCWDAAIVPGGMPGAANLVACEEIGAFLKEMATAGKFVCAICASPAVVLAPLGILSGKNFTCYPGLEEKVRDGRHSTDRVVIDGNIITSRGAGTAGEFAIAIISNLLDEATAKKTAASVLVVPEKNI